MKKYNFKSSKGMRESSKRPPVLEGACHHILSIYHLVLGPISILVLFLLTISLSSVLLTYLRGQSQEGWWSDGACFEFLFVYSLFL